MNSKAWDILLDEEKAALSLSINHSKSTWQAGEILNKAHYKYLEIHARAKKFFVMFTQYFKKTGDRLIPDNSEMSWDLRDTISALNPEGKVAAFSNAAGKIAGGFQAAAGAAALFGVQSEELEKTLLRVS